MAPEVRSWRTTIVALAAGITAVAAAVTAVMDGDPNTTVDADRLWVAVAAALAALQGFFSRDARVTSEGKRIAVLLFVLLTALPAAGWADTSAVIEGRGAAPGRYYLTVDVDAAGNLTIAAVDTVHRLSAGDRPAPIPTPAPGPPADPASLAGRIAAAARQVNQPDQAAEVAIIYRTIADQLAQGKLNRDLVGPALKGATDLALGDSAASWAAVRELISQELTAVLQGGGDYAATLRQIAAGLDQAAAGQAAAVDLERILKIIALVIELLERFR